MTGAELLRDETEQQINETKFGKEAELLLSWILIDQIPDAATKTISVSTTFLGYLKNQNPDLLELLDGFLNVHVHIDTADSVGYQTVAEINALVGSHAWAAPAKGSVVRLTEDATQPATKTEPSDSGSFVGKLRRGIEFKAFSEKEMTSNSRIMTITWIVGVFLLTLLLACLRYC